jgi:hypothetical protein
MKKRFLSILIAAIMVLTLLPFSEFTAFAENSGDMAITELEITLENYLAGYTVGDVVITDNSDLTDDNEYGWIDENEDGGKDHKGDGCRANLHKISSHGG